MGIIRFILAISVVIAHSGGFFGLHLVGGKIAVQTFYVISGFYMSLILNEKYISKNGSYKLFITNRFLRLFPTYFLILTLTIIFSVSMYYFKNSEQGALGQYINHANTLGFGAFFALIVTHISVFFQDILMFFAINIQTGDLFFSRMPFAEQLPVSIFLFIPQAWTIGVEILFYVIAPFIVRRSWKIVSILLIASVTLRVWLMSIGLAQDPWTYRFFPTELAFFLLGNLSYVLYKKISHITENTSCSEKAVRIITRVLPRFAPISLFIVLIYIACFDIFNLTTNWKWLTYAFIALFAILLPLIFNLTKKSRVDSYIGELSYPIYMSHVLIIQTLHATGIPAIAESTLLTILFTILVSIGINETLSKRIEKIRQRKLLSVNPL